MMSNDDYRLITSSYNFVNVIIINPLNAELNPICHLLALAGAHHFVHFSRLRVNPFQVSNSTTGILFGILYTNVRL